MNPWHVQQHSYSTNNIDNNNKYNDDDNKQIVTVVCDVHNDDDAYYQHNYTSSYQLYFIFYPYSLRSYLIVLSSYDFSSTI